MAPILTTMWKFGGEKSVSVKGRQGSQELGAGNPQHDTFYKITRRPDIKMDGFFLCTRTVVKNGTPCRLFSALSVNVRRWICRTQALHACTFFYWSLNETEVDYFCQAAYIHTYIHTCKCSYTCSVQVYLASKYIKQTLLSLPPTFVCT
jgi:hypothetical protein